MKATYHGDTNIGKVRCNNEDNLIAQQIWDDKHILLVVIDGVGGYEGGEVAAEVARHSIIKNLEDFSNANCIEQLKLAVVNANNDIVQYKLFVPKYGQMGCVLTAALIELDNKIVNIVHIGDTRLYQYHNGLLQKLTHDHSYVGPLEESGKLTEEEAMHHPHRNIIYRFLGDTIHILNDKKFIDAAIFPIHADSQLLLCSDGLYDMVTSEEICQILQKSVTAEEKVQMMIDKANANGGKDNITVIVADFSSTEKENTGTMATSKKLSYLLRHSDVPDDQGWIPLEKLVQDYDYTEQCVRQIVANDEKHRYEISDDDKSVRALYGHSNHVRIKYESSVPPAVLYHGTSRDRVDSILKDGLKPMSRQYVHISETIENAIEIGKRHGEPVVLAIDTQKVIGDGGCFYRVANGLWLTEGVKVPYLHVVV